MTNPHSKRRSQPIIACCEDPSQRQVRRAARAYLAAGLSFIPISADGTKQPAFDLLPWVERLDGMRKRSWGIFRERQPRRDEVDTWFAGQSDREYGMAILGGQISGGLEIIDFDTAELFEPWAKIVRQRAPGLLDRLILVETPRPGVHLYFRSKVAGGNGKLARMPTRPGGDKAWKPKTVIEVKGQGGYCLAPPSPRLCHPRQLCYKFRSDKDLTEIPTITVKQRQILFDAARGFDTWGEHRQRQRHRDNQSGPDAPVGGRPGDDFNVRADWADILEPHGWHLAGDDGSGIDYWCRPGKDFGISASTNYEGSDLLYVFSTNAAPFDDEVAYTKFSAYALLAHGGDFSEAARALAEQGYGKGVRGPRRRGLGLRDRYASCKLHSRAYLRFPR